MKSKILHLLTFLPYVIALFVGVVEFYIIYHSDLPPDYGYGPLPKQTEVQIMFNILNIDVVGLYSYLVHIPLKLAYLLLPISYSEFSSASFFLSFIIAFMSVFVSVRYFLKKYFNASNAMSSLIAILVDIPFQITYYNYGNYPALYLLTLALFDYGLDFGKISWREAFWRGLILALATSLGFEDPRSIFYTTITFFAYLSYYLVIKKKIEYLKGIIKVLLFGVPLLAILDFQIFLAVYLLAPYISSVGISTIYNQLATPLTWYYPFYTLLGTINFTEPLAYKSNLLYGAILVGMSFIALLKRNKISIFFSVLLLTIVTYDFIGTRTVDYLLANSPYVGYLIYLYVQYIPDYLYSAYFYPLVAFSLYSIYSVAIRKNKTIKATILFLVIILSTVGTIYYQPEASQLSKAYAPIPLFNNVRESMDYVSNATGIVLVLDGGEDYCYYQLYLPYMASPAGFGYMNFIWYSILNSPNPARALSYLGVQYIIINSSSYPEYYHFLEKSSGFRIVYQNNDLSVYENLYFKPYIISRGVYIAFNFPYVITSLSKLNTTYAIVPFYYINNLQQILPYVAGFIGYNVSLNDIIPMLVTNTTYIICPSNNYVNQLVDTNGFNSFNVGWIHSDPIWLPDLLNGITEGQNAKPLSMDVKVPDGWYYVYAVVAFYTNYNQYEERGIISISSGNNISKTISSNIYNVSWVYLGKLFVTGHKIVFHNVTNINLIKLVLVPDSEYNSLKNEAQQILNSRQVIDLSNFLIKNSSYIPTGYAVAVWGNPWIEFAFFAHEVKVDGKLIAKYQYYFGTAEVYITGNLPVVSLEKPVNITIPMLVFLVNVFAVILLLLRKLSIIRL
jgi:hypothetical protein